jgi:RND family efflux transporter MFP subunit
MTHRQRLITTAIGVGFLGAAIALWAWPQPAIEVQTDSNVAVVRVATVDSGPATRELRFSAVTRAENRASLSFPVPARLATRPVEIGDRVRAHEVVATLDDREFRNAVARSEALVSELDVRLAQSERDQRRVEHLAAARAATAEELEQVSAVAAGLKAARRATAAHLEEARRLLAEATLRAPFAGTVTDVRIEPGEWARPGRVVVELSGDGDLELEVEVPESVVPGLHAGQEVAVELPFANRSRVRGVIVSVSRAAVGPGRLFPVLVALETDHVLVAGLTAELELPVEISATRTVPLSAVLNPGSNSPGVFCVRAGAAHLVPVRLGPIVGDRIAVDGALEAGEAVVVAGHTQLVDGDRVEVAS